MPLELERTKFRYLLVSCLPNNHNQRPQPKILYIMSTAITPSYPYNPTCARFTPDTNGNSRLIVSIPEGWTAKDAQGLLGGRVATEGQSITLFTPFDNYAIGISLGLIVESSQGILKTLESLKETYTEYLDFLNGKL